MRIFISDSHSSYVKTALLWAVVSAITLSAAGAPAKAPPVRTDAEVARVFREKLAKSKLSADGIQIRVQDGVATLTGKTDIAQHKGTATRMARTSGAREVRNQIAITEAGKKKMLDRLHSVAVPAPVRAPQAGGKTAAGAPPVPSAPAAPAPPPVRRAQVKHP
jgi:hypothetical protein